MKLLRTIAVIGIFFSVLLLNWNCSEDQIPSSKSEIPQTDNVTNKVSISIWERVSVEPSDGGDSYEEWRPQIATFSCSDGTCFGPPYFMLDDGFYTPQSPRTENGNTVTTLYFKIFVGMGWHDIYPVGYYIGVVRIYDTYNDYCMKAEWFDPQEGAYSSECNNVTMPSNQYINVRYGVSSQQGDK